MAQRDSYGMNRPLQGAYTRVRLSADEDFEERVRRPSDLRPAKFKREGLHRSQVNHKHHHSHQDIEPLVELKHLHVKHHRDSQAWEEHIHFLWSIVNIVVTGGALAFSIITALYAFGIDCPAETCSYKIYITNTFFSTTTSGSVSGWPVATQRVNFDEVVQYPVDKDAFSFSHYYECMWTAKMADSLCDNSTVLTYASCLKGTEATSAALTTCNALSGSLSKSWPSAEEYLQCLFGFPVMRNSISARASTNVFRSCLAKTMWPFFEVQQGVDTPLFLGSFNWIIMLAVGLVCMTSFAVYTVSPVEEGMVKLGEPTYFMRLGSLWVTISTVWNVVFLVIFFVVAVRDGTVFDADGGLPTTVSTSVISIFVLTVCVFYFGSILIEAKDFRFGAHIYHYVSTKGLKRHGHILRDVDGADGRADGGDDVIAEEGSVNFKLGGLMPRPALEVYSITPEDVAKFYTPPLLPAWADGYFADACIFLGMAGATGHVTTDQAWNIFFIVMLYRILNMLIARYMYQCFMNNLSLPSAVNESYHSIVTHPQQAMNDRQSKADGEASSSDADAPHLNIQVMALSTQFAAILLFAALCVVVFNVDSPLADVPLFRLFFIFCFMIPEGLRILVHVACQLRKPHPNQVPWKLLNAFFFIWTYDIAIRVVFIMVVIWNVSKEHGSRTYLGEASVQLMDTYPLVLGLA